jgi:hypothetical protein
MESQLEQLLTNIETFKIEMLKLQNGTKVAGTRARKSLMLIKKNATDLRKSITEHVKSIPAKKPAKKPAKTAKPAKKPTLK